MSTTRKRANAAKLEGKKTEAVSKNPVAKQKIFLFNEQLLETSTDLKMYRLYHPGRERTAFFLLHEDTKQMYEILEYNQIHRTWLINENLSSNGKTYITVPIDVTFLALHYLKKFCSDRAIQLDQIDDTDHPAAHQMLTEYTTKDLENIADIKSSGKDVFYKYNSTKALAWLAVKSRRIAQRLKQESIYCGFSSLSANYAKSSCIEEAVDDSDYLKNACGIIGNYISASLHADLMEYLCINEDENVAKNANGKRKSIQQKSEDVKSKKIKLEEARSPPPAIQPQPVKLKEKKVNAKEKALAKAASGTKSISAFFKK